jgi:hypothetical protein
VQFCFQFRRIDNNKKEFFMGIKLGIAGEASRKNLFIYLAINKEHHLPLAEIKTHVEKNSTMFFYLRYPDGVIGFLEKNNSCQLRVQRKVEVLWVPTEVQMSALQGTLSKEFIIFAGEYQVREMTESDLFPPQEHESVMERFRNPEGIWDKVVAGCLGEIKN